MKNNKLSIEGKRRRSSSNSLKSGFKWNGLDSFSVILLKVIRGFIVPILLVPTQYGLFASIGVFTRYLQFSDFGAKQYLTKSLPEVLSSSDKIKQKKLLSETLSFIFLSFFLVIIYLLASSIFYNGKNKQFYHLAILFLIPIVLFSKSSEILSVYALSAQNYKYPAVANILKNILSFFLVVIAIYLWGAIGGVAALIFVELIVLFYLYSRIKIDFSVIIDIRIFSRVSRYLKLFFVSLSETFINTYDSLIIIFLFSTKELGVFSLGIAFGWPFIALSGILVTTLQPEMNKYINNNQSEVDRLFIRFYKRFLLIVAAIINPLFIVVFYLIENYYSKYNSGLHIYFLLITTYVFRSSNMIIRQYFIAKNNELNYVYNALKIIGVIFILVVYFYFHRITFNQLIYFIFAIDLLFLIINFYRIARITSLRLPLYYINYGIVLYIAINGLLIHFIYEHFAVSVSYSLIGMAVFIMIPPLFFLLKAIKANNLI